MAERGRRRVLWWLIVLCGWIVGWHGAWAAAPSATPTGWVRGGSANPQARGWAEELAQVWDGEVRDVMSTRARDDFVETLAVFDLAGPLPVEALADLDGATRWLSQRVLEALGPEATADTVELVPADEPGVAIVQARVVSNDEVLRMAFAPVGARHLAVVLLMPAAEEVLYARVFDDAVEGLTGLRRPITPFPRSLARLVAIALWVAAGILSAIVWTRRSLPRPGARVAGRQVAGLMVGAAVLSMLVAGLLLGDSAVELSLAGGSPWGFAFELGIGGVVMAVVIVATTELWERRLQPVASAPRAGSFAVTGASRRRAAESPSTQATTHRLASSSGVMPAATGDTTQVQPAPAVTGDTQVGPPPAVTGNTQVGPPPSPTHDDNPPIREVISGTFEVETQVTRAPTAGAQDGPAWLDDPSDAPAQPHDRAASSDLFPLVRHDQRPGPDDSHPALDAPLPPRRDS